MCVFRVDSLVLDRQEVSFSLGKTISPVLSVLWLPVVLCVQLKPCGLSPLHFNLHTFIFNRVFLMAIPRATLIVKTELNQLTPRKFGEDTSDSPFSTSQITTQAGFQPIHSGLLIWTTEGERFSSP